MYVYRFMNGFEPMTKKQCFDNISYLTVSPVLKWFISRVSLKHLMQRTWLPRLLRKIIWVERCGNWFKALFRWYYLTIGNLAMIVLTEATTFIYPFPVYISHRHHHRSVDSLLSPFVSVCVLCVISKRSSCMSHNTHTHILWIFIPFVRRGC